MLAQAAVAVALLLVAVGVAWWLRRRRPEPAPRGVAAPVPVRVDRRDFPRPEAPWLVVLFSSSTCLSCAAMAQKVAVLASGEVAVAEVEYTHDPALHRRYAIDAVPIVVIADAEGVTRRAFVGPATATDLWAAVAELRAPGSSPEPGLGRV